MLLKWTLFSYPFNVYTKLCLIRYRYKENTKSISDKILANVSLSLLPPSTVFTLSNKIPVKGLSMCTLQQGNTF
jgi:hypothetical protein